MRNLVIPLSTYFFIFFFLSRLVVPHLRKINVPEEVKKDFMGTVKELSEDYPCDLELLQAALDVLKERYTTIRYQTHFMFWIVFRKDIDKIWSQKGKNQACNVLNFLFKTMLVKSGRFPEERVRQRRIKYSVHQYLEIELKDGSVIYADPWGYIAGRTELGEYTSVVSGKRGNKVSLGSS